MYDSNTIALPPTPKQVDYARQIASRLQQTIPQDCVRDRRTLSEWIGKNQSLLKQKPAYSERRATSKQVAFAEKIARRSKVTVPQECFLSANLMSRWIDHNARSIKTSGRR